MGQSIQFKWQDRTLIILCRKAGTFLLLIGHYNFKLEKWGTINCRLELGLFKSIVRTCEFVKYNFYLMTFNLSENKFRETIFLLNWLEDRKMPQRITRALCKWGGTELVGQ